jgi:hypothetical protein
MKHYRLVKNDSWLYFRDSQDNYYVWVSDENADKSPVRVKKADAKKIWETLIKKGYKCNMREDI